MAKSAQSVAIVAPANRLAPEAAAKVKEIAEADYGGRLKLFFHPQCYLQSGHFAGSDIERSGAFLEVANDPSFDAVWFARGGYGCCRIHDVVFGKFNRAAHLKTYLGYSDLGFLLARLTREGVGTSVHGPMPTDVNREGGGGAIRRALSWLVDRDGSALEPHVRPGQPAFAFNLTVLCSLLGTAAEPDFSGAVLMLEEIDEPHYRIDRAMFQITSNANVRQSAGIRLGRMSKIPPNDPPFEKTEREIVAYWCNRSGIPFLGEADIGHDADNKIVPYPIHRPSRA
jgi:muramoyltetrapeptide carboxypeptidase